MEHFRKGKPLTEAGRRQYTKIKLKDGSCANCKFSEAVLETIAETSKYYCMNAPNDAWLEVPPDDWCLFWEEEDFVPIEVAEAYNETKRQIGQYVR